MSGTVSPKDLSDALWNSFVVLPSAACGRVGDKYAVFGTRPAEGRWHSHGYFERRLWVLIAGRPRRIALLKHRWKRVGSNETRHSRLPCEVGQRGVCELLFVLLLWFWLDGDRGLFAPFEEHREIREVVSRRTQQRYLALILDSALSYQQILRETIIERSEPRPAKHLYPRGLSPPTRLSHHSWRHRTKTRQLWTGLSILLCATDTLQIPAARMLAEARGRETHRTHPLAG